MQSFEEKFVPGRVAGGQLVHHVRADEKLFDLKSAELNVFAEESKFEAKFLQASCGLLPTSGEEAANRYLGCVGLCQPGLPAAESAGARRACSPGAEHDAGRRHACEVRQVPGLREQVLRKRL